MKNELKMPDPKKAKRYFARKLAFTADPADLSRWLNKRKDIRVLDVRDAKSFAKGHVPGAIHLPEEKWSKTKALDKRKTYIVYSESPTCRLAARAAFELASQGFPVMELAGGFETWKDQGRRVEKGSAAQPAPRSKPGPNTVVAEPVEDATQTEDSESPPVEMGAAETNADTMDSETFINER